MLLSLKHSRYGFTVGIDGAAPPVAAVPEPETWALMLGGVGLLGLVSRRRRRG